MAHEAIIQWKSLSPCETFYELFTTHNSFLSINIDEQINYFHFPFHQILVQLKQFSAKLTETKKIRVNILVFARKINIIIC